MKIGVLSSGAGWHFRDLVRAADDLADVDVASVDFRRLGAWLQEGSDGVEFPCSGARADALLVRIMPAGSLQQVVFRMDCLQRLAATGFPIINPPRAMEIAIDKYLSLCLIAEAGIAVPDFEVCQSVQQAVEAFDKLGRDVVLKPIFGSMGRDLIRLNCQQKAIVAFEDFVRRGEVLYLQRFVDSGGFDIRAFVIGDAVLGMKRIAAGGDWRTNATCGGTCSPHVLTQQEKDIALRAAASNQCQIAGVDLIYDQNNPSRTLVLEVNAAPGWEHLSKVSEIDIAAMTLRHVAQFANRN